MDIREFLTARLDEDEATARAAADFGERWRFADDIFPSDDARHPGAIISGSYGCGIPDQYGEHVVRHDPARVLRDVEAKRRILAAYTDDDHVRFGGWETCSDSCPVSVLDEVVKLLALPYADHPDYDPSWSPA